MKKIKIPLIAKIYFLLIAALTLFVIGVGGMFSDNITGEHKTLINDLKATEYGTDIKKVKVTGFKNPGTLFEITLSTDENIYELFEDMKVLFDEEYGVDTDITKRIPYDVTFWFYVSHSDVLYGSHRSYSGDNIYLWDNLTSSKGNEK